jgi:hypothetical protein
MIHTIGYGSPHAYFLLSLIYPNVDFKIRTYQVDHIHPRSKFNRTNLVNNGIEDEELIEEWISEKKDLLPNLQLLAGIDNNNKKSKALKDYLKDKSIKDRRILIKENFLPSWGQRKMFELYYFDEFYNYRAKQLFRKLKSVFKV